MNANIYMRVPKNVTCCSILCINWGYDGVAKGAASWQCEWEVLTAADFGGMLQFRCDMRERWVGKVANAAAVELLKLFRACCSFLRSDSRSSHSTRLGGGCLHS